MKNKKGFTLIEILVAMGIVGILASVVLVSMGGYRIRANAAKINASLSSAVTSMASCWSMGGYVVEPPAYPYLPSAGRNICTFSSTSTSSYGKWPDISSLAANYVYSENNASNSLSGCTDCLPLDYNLFSYVEEKDILAKSSLLNYIIDNAYAVSSPRGLPKTTPDWFFSAKNATDKQKICCNKKMSGCKVIDSSTACDNTIN